MKTPNNKQVWEKLYNRNDCVPMMLSELLFDLAIISLAGDWRLGALFAFARMAFGRFMVRLGRDYSHALSLNEFQALMAQAEEDGDSEETDEEQDAPEEEGEASKAPPFPCNDPEDLEAVVWRKTREMRVLQNVFLFLLVVADVAVGVWGSRYQVLPFYASQIPWALQICFSTEPRLVMKVVTLDENGNEIGPKEPLAEKCERLLAEATRRCGSYVRYLGFIAALLAAGTDLRLAMMMTAGDVAFEMVDYCDKSIWYERLDALFSGIDE